MNNPSLKIKKINEDIIRSVIKKVINSTSSDNMPFNSLSLTITKSGYGFTLRKSTNDHYLSVRTKEKLSVIIRNESIDYAKTFLISDVTLDKLPTGSSTESYKKYCINTIYTIIKTWINTPENRSPDLGEWHLYKY